MWGFLFLAFALSEATKANKRLTREASHKSARIKPQNKSKVARCQMSNSPAAPF